MSWRTAWIGWRWCSLKIQHYKRRPTARTIIITTTCWRTLNVVSAADMASLPGNTNRVIIRAIYMNLATATRADCWVEFDLVCSYLHELATADTITVAPCVKTNRASEHNIRFPISTPASVAMATGVSILCWTFKIWNQLCKQRPINVYTMWVGWDERKQKAIIPTRTTTTTTTEQTTQLAWQI